MPKYVWIENGDQKIREDLELLPHKEGGQGDVYFPPEIIIEDSPHWYMGHCDYYDDKYTQSCIKVLKNTGGSTVQLDTIAKMLAHPAQLYEQVNNVGTVPDGLVWDENKKIIGYTMWPLDDDWHGLHEITTTSDSEALGVDLKSAGRIMASLSKAIRVIHSQGFVIGDLNPSNVLFNVNDCCVKVIDVDSWSIHRPDLGLEYSSTVLDIGEIYHPDFIAADRKGEERPAFTQSHDWWAFAYICWKVLTKFDIYQKGDAGEIEKEDRILKKLTTISRATVKQYPKLGPAVQALGPKLWFSLDRCLKRKVQQPFPTKLLEDFADNLRTCACGFTAHASAVICPKCAATL